MSISSSTSWISVIRSSPYFPAIAVSSSFRIWDYILFFTDTGKVYRKKGYQIPVSGKTAKGTNIV